MTHKAQVGRAETLGSEVHENYNDLDPMRCNGSSWQRRLVVPNVYGSTHGDLQRFESLEDFGSMTTRLDAAPLLDNLSITDDEGRALDGHEFPIAELQQLWRKSKSDTDAKTQKQIR